MCKCVMSDIVLPGKILDRLILNIGIPEVSNEKWDPVSINEFVI